MSEMPAGPAPGGRKILGLKPKTLLIGGGVLFLGVLGYLWWRSKHASSASSASTTTSASASAGAYNAATLAGLQDELEELLSQQGGSSASTGTSSGGGSGGGTGTTTSPPPTKTTTPPPTTGTSPPVTKTAAKPKPITPDAHATKTTATSVTISWGKIANATSYRVRVTYQDKLVGTPHIVTGTSATISGLAPLRTYTFHVAAIGPGGTSAETNGPAVKTK
jgi:cytoskeletal protein RodZ